jgi:hypothetical protein
MPTHCCENMDSNTRRQEPWVPESEKRDASIEFIAEFGVYLIAQNNGSFALQIQYCPWCGADLSSLETWP